MYPAPMRALRNVGDWRGRCSAWGRWAGTCWRCWLLCDQCGLCGDLRSGKATGLQLLAELLDLLLPLLLIL